MATVNTPASTGAGDCSPRSDGDLPGVPALVDPPHQDEERGDDQPVVDHLEHAAGESLAVEGEGAEHDEPDLGQRRVGQQPLQVALGTGDDRAVEDADRPPGSAASGARVRLAWGKRLRSKRMIP